MVVYCTPNKESDDKKLYPIEINGKYGYVDRTGKVEIDPIFDEAEDFEDLSAVVEINGKYGLINQQGEFVMNPSSNYISKEEKGNRIIEIADQQFVIRHSDKKHYPLQEKVDLLQRAGPFFIAWVFPHHSPTGKSYQFVVNNHGKRISKNFSQLYYQDEEGLFTYGVISIGEDPKIWKKSWGLIDTNGNVVLKPTFDYIHDFSEGYAAVELDESRGTIDKYGKIVIGLGEFSALSINEGLAPAAIKIGEKQSDDNSFFNSDPKPILKFGYIDVSGKIRIRYQFDFADDFKDGAAKVGVGDYAEWATPHIITANEVLDEMAYGFIDKKGKYIIPPIYKERFGYFHNDSTGNAPVLQLRFEIADSMIVLYKGRKYGAFNVSGKQVLPFEYDYLENFNHGYAGFQKGSEVGIVDRSGKSIFHTHGDYISFFADGFDSNGIAYVNVNGTVCLIDLSGKLIFKSSSNQTD